MAKLKIQAQHLQSGDIVGSGEVVNHVTISSTQWPSNKVRVALESKGFGISSRLWGKYTEINIERPEKVDKVWLDEIGMCERIKDEWE